MRKLFVVFLVILMIVSIVPCTSFAAFEDKTDEELIADYNAIRLELGSRGYKAENKRVLYEGNGVQIYLNGDLSVEDNWMGPELIIPVVIVNGTDKNLYVQTRSQSINGWACDAMFSPEIPAGKKIKEDLGLLLEETDMTKIEEFEDAEFSFHIFSDDNWMDSWDTESIRIVAD